MVGVTKSSRCFPTMSRKTSDLTAGRRRLRPGPREISLGSRTGACPSEETHLWPQPTTVAGGSAPAATLPIMSVPSGLPSARGCAASTG